MTTCQQSALRWRAGSRIATTPLTKPARMKTPAMNIRTDTDDEL